MTKVKINRAIKHTGLTIHGKRGDGCYYFLDENENQIGLSIYIYKLSQLNLTDWVRAAEYALKEGS